MKNKLTKILGIFLTTAIVASMFVSAIPAAATAQDWEKITTPANIAGMLNNRVLSVGPIERAINGDLYCAVTLTDNPDTVAKTSPVSKADWNVEKNEVVIYRSTDFGRTWAATAKQPLGPGFEHWAAGSAPTYDWEDDDGNKLVILDIECSSADPNTLWVTNGDKIWETNNNGKTWEEVDYLFDEDFLSLGPDGLIVSISVGYRNGTATLFAATSTFAGAAHRPGPIACGYGGVYSLQLTINGSNWIDLNIASQTTAWGDYYDVAGYHADPTIPGDKSNLYFDVLEVAVTPTYSIDEGVAAVVSFYEAYQLNAVTPSGGVRPTGQTWLITRFRNQQWGQRYAPVTLKYNKSGNTTGYVNAILMSATIWFPSDYADEPMAFVGIAPLADNTLASLSDNFVSWLNTANVAYFSTHKYTLSFATALDQGDVYLCPLNAKPARYTITTSASGVERDNLTVSDDLDVRGPRTGTTITDMDGAGEGWTASLVASGFEPDETTIPRTWATQDGGNNWAEDLKRPTGGASTLPTNVFGASWSGYIPPIDERIEIVLNQFALSSVRVHANFAENGLAVVGTHGRSGDSHGLDVTGDAGLSISHLPTDVCDRGFTWNTIWFISTKIDQKVDMSIAADNTIYLTTYYEVNTHGTYQLYSAWRYMYDSGDNKWYWERVNSYSLYNPVTRSTLVSFDFVRTTAANDYVLLVDRSEKKFYFSENRGNKWTTLTARTFPLEITEPIYSVLLVGARNIMVGVGNGRVVYSRNHGAWNIYQAFSTATVGNVTDLRLASNGDVIAAGIGPRVFIARSRATGATSTYATWEADKNTGVFVSDWAFAAPANDYATSNVVAVTSDVAFGIFYRPYTSDAVQADEYWEWTDTLGAYGSFTDALVGDERYLSNLVTAPGKPGFDAEGNGMAYLNAMIDPIPIYDDVTGALLGINVKHGVARVKGRVMDTDDTRAAERIDYPFKANSTTDRIDLEGLWAGPASVGSVILYAFGTDCNIYFYTDTLNQPVTGLVVTKVEVDNEDCTVACPQTFRAHVQWDALQNVTHYLLIISDEPIDNFYDAVDALANGALGSIQLANKTAAIVPGLKSQTEFFVSVWGFKYTAKGNLTGTVAAMANSVIDNAISSFGVGASFTTPPTEPTVNAPAAGATVTIRPVFQWTQVVGATSYTLTVADNPNFTNPIKSVTTTSTAYGWGANDTPLNYATTYYWRVIATTASGNSNSSVNIFTTENPPPPTQPTPTLSVIVPTVTATVAPPVVTVPPFTVVVPTPTFVIPTMTIVQPPPPDTSTPLYIWIIVAVGAILTIAVIILIIRTRRVV